MFPYTNSPLGTATLTLSTDQHGSTENKKDIAEKWQVGHFSIFMQPSILFYTLNKPVDVEDITNEKDRTLDFSREGIIVISQLKSLLLYIEVPNRICESDFRLLFDPNEKSKHQFRKDCK